MTPHENGSIARLTTEDEREYENVLDAVRGIIKKNPELGLDFILNSLVATGETEVADRIQAWATNVCAVEEGMRGIYCHGRGPRPDRIVPVPTMKEIENAAVPFHM